MGHVNLPGDGIHDILAEGKLYFCAVKDCWSNKIVGYSVLRTAQVLGWKSTAVSVGAKHEE
jgi:transposase InsO family protein